MRFASHEFSIEYPRVRDDAGVALPTLRVAFLSLAGIGGALPLMLSERILHEYNEGGKALHAFLDLLNRRFWELLFLAQGIGGNPQYAFLDSSHVELLSCTSFAIAGLSDKLRLGSTPIDVPHLALIERYCVEAGSGWGHLRELEQLLTQMLDAEVQLKQYEPIRLKVISSSLTVLGAGPSSGGLARSAVLGLNAWVPCAWNVTVRVSSHEKVRDFLPGMPIFRRLHKILGVILGNARAPLRLHLQSPTGPSRSQLGATDMLLGWGARLWGKEPCIQIIDISADGVESASVGGLTT